VLFPIVVEVEEDDAVPLLDRAETMEHRNIRGAPRTPRALGLAEIHQIGEDKPTFGRSRAQVEVEGPVVIEIAERGSHGADRHVEEVAPIFEPALGRLNKYRGVARVVSAKLLPEDGHLSARLAVREPR